MKSYIAISICLLAFLHCSAQDVLPSKWSASLTFANLRYPLVSIHEDGKKDPFFYGAIHPSISVAVERNWKQTEKNRWFQTLELQYFSFQHVDYGIAAITEIGYEHRYWQKLIFGVRLGAGRQLAWKDDQYQVYTDGEWKTLKDPGSALGRWILQPRINLGWQISPHLDALLGLRAQAVTPFYKPLSIPLNISAASELSVRWRF